MAFSVDQVLGGLTEPQREAATVVDGPLLVLAGAGSGKTRTITRRIAYMIACGIPASSILAITFTNKAAGEMRERVNHLLAEAGRAGWGVTVATFHSLCVRILREHAEAAGLSKTFTIYDSADQTKAIKQAIKDLNLSPENFQPAAVHSAISKAKNDLKTASAYAQEAPAFFEKNVARIYAKYEAVLAGNKAVDFDDLLLKTAIMLRDNKDVRAKLQEKYQYISIDEYQDTNHAQFVIAHMLAMNHKNICATGDPDQSIYGWRGANINNILEFEEFYPNAKVVLLEQNYRSTKTILKAASALIANNVKRKKKELWTENETGPQITKLTLNDEHHEASEIVRRIKEAHDKEKLDWDKFAIFYRVNSLSRVLEETLMKAGVPYQIARGTEFYARKEIKDVLSYLRVVANPSDNVSLERIINVPGRALGDTSVAKLAAFAGEHGLSLLEACGRVDELAGTGGLMTRAITSAKKLAGQFAAWRAMAYGQPEEADSKEPQPEAHGDDPLFSQSLADMMAEAEEISEEITEENSEFGVQNSELEGQPAAAAVPGKPRVKIKDLMDRIVKESGMEGDLKKNDGEDQGADKLANVAELISVAAEFDAQCEANGLPGTLDDYLEQVTLVSDVDRLKDTGGSVTLMTLHAAKGLEFPFVAMAGCEDGLMPHSRAISFGANPDEMEEERRLAFVGITRAMKHLIMTVARYRMVRGETVRTVESQFFGEMPDECFDEHNLAGDDEGAGSLGYRDEAGYGRRAANERRQYEAVAQRSEANATAGEFKRGQLVRHAQFGLGRIEDISAAGTMTRAVVKFQGIPAAKTLILQYAKLEKVDA